MERADSRTSSATSVACRKRDRGTSRGGRPPPEAASQKDERRRLSQLLLARLLVRLERHGHRMASQVEPHHLDTPWTLPRHLLGHTSQVEPDHHRRQLVARPSRLVDQLLQSGPRHPAAEARAERREERVHLARAQLEQLACSQLQV